MENVLQQLRKASQERAVHWNKGNPAPNSFAFIELFGEVGEVCNACKKLLRHEMGWVGGESDITNLKEELADVMICVDLIAARYGVDMWEAIKDKFNKTSDKHGFPVKL